MQRTPTGFRLTALAMTVLIVAAVSLSVGSVRVPLADVVTALWEGEATDPTYKTIVLDIRLPRMLVAIVAGAALASAGLAMQTLFRNPLAGPYVLGVDAGASLGVAAVTLSLGAGKESFLATVGLWTGMARLSAATVGAAGALGLVMLVAARVGNDLTILVVGLLTSYFVSGLIGLLVYQAAPESVQRYLLWTFGSFDNVAPQSLALFATAAAVGVLLLISRVKGMDGLVLGEEQAEALGVPVPSTRFRLVVGSSLLAAAVTATCGPVGFVGVAVPHLTRWLLGSSSHRVLLPGSLLVGSLVALLADLVARGASGGAPVPINVVTSLFGAPVLLVLVLRRRGSVR